MNILAIETTGAEASVAIIDEAGKITDAISHENLNHLSFLMPLIGEALEKASLKMSDIDVVAASEGPGSFTGIRIGVSSARALAQALNIPCIAVPTLKAFLYNLDENDQKFKETCEEFEQTVFCPLFDARRSQVYGGAYAWSGAEATSIYEQINEVVEGKAYMLSEILEHLAEEVNNADATTSYKSIIFFGDGVDKYVEEIKNWAATSLKEDVTIEFAEEAKRYQHAVSVAKLAKELSKDGRTCHYNDLKPNYMRKAEAERKLEEAKAAKQTEEARG